MTNTSTGLQLGSLLVDDMVYLKKEMVIFKHEMNLESNSQIPSCQIAKYKLTLALLALAFGSWVSA